MKWSADGCKQRMWKTGGFSSVQCGKKLAGEHGFCAIHSPEAVAKRKAKAELAWAEKSASWERQRAETEERERIIAAFPELLAALRLFVKVCDSAPPVEFVSMIGHACVVARAAIAKAEAKP